MDRTRGRPAPRWVTVLALALAASFGVGAEGLTWNSYAEAGLGLSMAGGVPRPLGAFDAGIFLGPVELGTYLAILPLEFGSPDLLKAGAVHYGGTLGVAFGQYGAVRPYGRLALGGVVRERADERGAYTGDDAEKFFSLSFIVGVEVPLGVRWSLRPWAAWRLAPEASDYEGRSLSGPEAGLAVRATWQTTLQ